MRILLTGASGFLGSALAHHWGVRGQELWLLARPTSDLSRVKDLPATVRCLRASTPDEVAAAVREASPDAIVHTACAYGRKSETPLDLLDTNVRFGMVLLQSVLSGPVGHTAPITFLNTGTVLDPNINPYALSKAQFSAWGAALATQAPARLRFIDIRLQQMYGPGDDLSKFTTHVIDACCRGEPRLALTAGEQRRDFIHIEDVVRAYDRILARSSTFAANDSIEVGSGTAITMRSFVELAKEVAGARTELDFGAVPYRANEAMLCVADTRRLRSLGWKPEVSLVDGLKSMINRLP